MKVYEPSEYPIEFSNEEIESFKTTAKYLKAIHETMTSNRCDTLEGGYPESPTFFPAYTIDGIVMWLNEFVKDLPNKMY